MKLFFLALLSLSLFAQTQKEYPFIKPVSVEVAPLKQQTAPMIMQTQEVAQAKKQPKTDSDQDGILDSADICPGTPKDFIVDASGCPVQATLKINFDSNSYKISEQYHEALKKFADFLLQNEEYQVLIYGFSDVGENDNESKILSQKRANAVKETLMRSGVSSTKLTAIGRADENPLSQSQNEEERAKNRRIEIEIIP